MQQAQTATPDSATQQVFHQEADTFDLTVTLTDHKLIVVLKDYVDWVIYEKEYTEHDIGKDIHKKMDLSDVYSVFNSSVEYFQEEEEGTEMQEEDTEMMEYKFGEVVEDEDVSYYKIEKGGKITVYYGITNNKNQQVNFESQLVLVRGKEVSEIQRAEVKLAVKVMQYSQKIQRMNQKKEMKAEEQRKRDLAERDKLLRRVTKIEEKGKEIITLEMVLTFILFICLAVIVSLIVSSVECGSLSSKIQTASLENIQKVNNLGRNLTEAMGRINHDLLLQVKDLQSTLKALREEITEINEKSTEGLKEAREELTNEIRNSKQELSEKLEAQIQETSSKFEENEQVLKPIVKLNQIHSLSQKYESKFRVQGGRVKHITSPEWHPYVFNYPIRHNETAKFRIKITRTWNRQIMIGVVDYAQQKNERKFHDSGSALFYHGLDGRKSPNSRQGNGFRQGDIVQVRVDRTIGQIAWHVNGQFKASLSSRILADKMRVFMPYVQMWNDQETVEWIVGDQL